MGSEMCIRDREQGRQRQVTAELTARFKGLEPGQRLEIGLLLADLLRQSGSDQTAMRLYGQLATENKTDARPCWPWPYCDKSKAIQRQLKPCSSRPENGGMPMGGSIH